MFKRSYWIFSFSFFDVNILTEHDLGFFFEITGKRLAANERKNS